MAPVPSFADGNSLFEFVVGKGNGVKGMVDSGISAVPDRYIQPVQERIDHANSHVLQPIDLLELDGPHRERAVEELTQAAETLGFFQVVNHGVPVELLEQLKEAAHRFFNLPAEKKAFYLKGVSPSPHVKYGTSFVPEMEKALEWKDYLSMVYTSDSDAAQYWPAECKEVALEFLKTSSKMVRKIFEALIGSLGVTLDDSMADVYIGSKMVNMNFYPTCPNPELTVGVGRHSDMGTLTVLLQDGIGGLYVKMEDEEEEKGSWVEIPPISGALVINVGDTLQILSNGRYKSAEHRVRTTSAQARVSVPIFNFPRPGDSIGPLPQAIERDGKAHYRELLFGDYMKNFFGKAHEGKKSLDFAKFSDT